MIRAALSLVPVWAWVGVAAILLGGVYARGYLDGTAAGVEKWAKERERLGQQIEEANRRAHLSGEHYERLRSQDAVKSIARHKEIRRANDADAVWSRAAVPDGVRRATEAAAADTGAGEPD